jgi:hypothetical protein
MAEYTPEQIAEYYYSLGVNQGYEYGQSVQRPDPRVDELAAAWQEQRELAAYDQIIDQIVSDPYNADINPNRLHLYVSAAEGNFDRALAMYRADAAEEEARIARANGLEGRQPDPAAQTMARAQAGVEQEQTTGSGRYSYERAADGRLTPQGELHAQIDEVMRQRRGS